MAPPEGSEQFICPLCASDRFYLIRHEINDIEALEMIANGTNLTAVNMRRFMLPLYAHCSECGSDRDGFRESVSLVDHALKIGATRWEIVIITDDGTVAYSTKDDTEGLDR